MEENHPVTEMNDPSFSGYLEQLSKKELIDLVERFAPEEFRTMIHNQFISQDESVGLVANVVKEIDQALRDHSLYDEPTAMEEVLEEQLIKLKGLGEKEAETVYELITTIIHKVNDLTEEGWLYDHYRDQHFDEYLINEFTRSFLKPLPLDKKTKYIDGFKSAIEDNPYTFFEGIFTNLHELFEERDLPELKEVLLLNTENKEFTNLEAYYTAVASKLSLDEKFFILSQPDDLSAALSIQLAKVYEEYGKIAFAIDALEKCHKTDDFWSVKEAVFNELLRLKHLNESLDLSFAEDMLNQLAKRKTLRTLIEYFPANKSHFEGILRQEATPELLEYFEEEKRLDEALELVLNDDLYENIQYQFFKKHATLFPEEARVYFIKRIDENLVDAGNHYYERIVDTLNTLKTIDARKADEIKAMIQGNYKRRTNLMAMLK